ncbi:MAG TPA: UDP-N-acetylglucosamine--N-acetylmuramyl-(pentapeptide) pyrophosphoryl-undecaprenol N-acetylglucosamine transferase [Ilumatobacter sp.]|nr:UDP-N-acetylglucosamine--N-acetylmuramyl-(pentapeptide) pyrophosphoryl-undecaprenol N-acetylglucosamine transferase [Ilumatobacter sp.]
MSTFAVVTGGGTAGHVLPALAVADGLVAAGYEPSQIRYMGARRGIETRLLPPTEYPSTFLDVVGFQRSLSRRNIVMNLQFVPRMWRARREAMRMFRADRPAVVVSVGGYASMPAVFAARRLEIPIVVVSFDLIPGRASRLAAKHAAACAVAFPDSSLPNAILTGAPVRQAVLAVDRTADRDVARAALGLPTDRFVVAVMGGSQGSGVLNDAVDRLLDASSGDSTLAIRHAVGDRFVHSARPATDGSEGVLYQPVGYESDMPAVYAAADLLIGRGGASTAHEVAVTGVPAILVPWAESADDHQTLNVRWLSDPGAAICLAEPELGDLPAVIARLRASPDELGDLSRAAKSMGEVHRSGALAGLVVQIALA